MMSASSQRRNTTETHGCHDEERHGGEEGKRAQVVDDVESCHRSTNSLGSRSEEGEGG